MSTQRMTRRDLLMLGLGTGTTLALGVGAVEAKSKGSTSQNVMATATTHVVETISSLRALTAPKNPMTVVVKGHHRIGDGGGGLFYWDAVFLSPPQNVSDDGGTCILPHGNSATNAGRWRRIFDGALNAHWFGALGDNTGRTPQDDGIDISTAPWNVWPTYLTRDKSNNPNYFGFDTKAVPFSSKDSWDWIGIQMALFSAGEHPGEVAVGGGIYQLSKTLFYANGMRATLTGAGMYQTTLTKKPGHFNDSSILYLYRIGGTPTTIRGITFSGPYGGGTTGFTLISHNNTNGVHIEDCWFTTCQVGVYYVNNSGDSYVTNCTAEFCETVLSLDLDSVHENDGGSDVTVTGCNFWQSAVGQAYTGIAVKGGSLHCNGTRFIGFNGTSIGTTIGTNRLGKNVYANLLITGNHFLDFRCVSSALSGNGRSWVVSGNRFVGAAGAFIAQIPERSTFNGNYVEVTNDHACLNINQGAKYTTVTGNTFISTSGKATIEGGLVVSVKQGESYSGGCSDCVITGNSCSSIPSAAGNGIHVDASTASGNIITSNIVS